MRLKMVVGAVVLTLGLAACASDAPSAPVSSGQDTFTLEAPVTTACIDVDTAIALSQDSSTQLTNASNAADTGDVASMAMYAGIAADDWFGIAEAVQADPVMEQYALQAANALQDASTLLTAGDIRSASLKVQEATVAISSATDQVNTTTVPAC